MNLVDREAQAVLIENTEDQYNFWVFQERNKSIVDDMKDQTLYVAEVPGKGRAVFVGMKGRERESKEEREDEVPPGTTIWKANGTAAIVMQNHLNRLCHQCFQRSPKMYRCADCESALYCSRNCLSAHASVHNQLCRALLEMKNMDKAIFQNDVDSVRLALELLQLRISPGDEWQNPLDSLEAHWEDVPVNERNNALRKAHAVHSTLWNYLPFPASEPLINIAKLFLTIRFNSHPVELHGLSGAVLGLFPSAALLNHSCCPEVVMFAKASHGTVKLHIRTVKAILPGQEIHCSYIDELCAPTVDRRSILQDSFLFTCNCKRCSQPDPEFPAEILICKQCNTSLLSNTVCENKECALKACNDHSEKSIVKQLKERFLNHGNALDGSNADLNHLALDILNRKVPGSCSLHLGHQLRHSSALLALSTAKVTNDMAQMVLAAQALIECWRFSVGHTNLPQVGALYFLIAKTCLDSMKNHAHLFHKDQVSSTSVFDDAFDVCCEALSNALGIFSTCYGYDHQQTERVKKLKDMFLFPPS